MVIISASSATTINPAITSTSCDIFVSPLEEAALLGQRGWRLLAAARNLVRKSSHCVPCANIRDSALVVRNDHFRAALKRFAILAARASEASCAVARKQHFAGAARTNGARHTSEDSDHVIVGGVHDALTGMQEPKKCRHRGSSREPGQSRKEYRGPN